MTPRELIDWTLRASGWGTLSDLEAKRWIDCQPDFATAHYVNGFPWPDGRFRFKPDWRNVPFRSPIQSGPVDGLPILPDHWDVIEEADETVFWLEMLVDGGFVRSKRLEKLQAEANQLLAIFAASRRTAKE